MDGTYGLVLSYMRNLIDAARFSWLHRRTAGLGPLGLVTSRWQAEMLLGIDHNILWIWRKVTCELSPSSGVVLRQFVGAVSVGDVSWKDRVLAREDIAGRTYAMG